eukprot:jgi/Bigna1/91342/estExt_fgenesh1_pg.C_970034
MPAAALIAIRHVSIRNHHQLLERHEGHPLNARDSLIINSPKSPVTLPLASPSPPSRKKNLGEIHEADATASPPSSCPYKPHDTRFQRSVSEPTSKPKLPERKRQEIARAGRYTWERPKMALPKPKMPERKRPASAKGMTTREARKQRHAKANNFNTPPITRPRPSSSSSSSQAYAASPISIVGGLIGSGLNYLWGGSAAAKPKAKSGVTATSPTKMPPSAPPPPRPTTARTPVASKETTTQDKAKNKRKAVVPSNVKRLSSQSKGEALASKSKAPRARPKNGFDAISRIPPRKQKHRPSPKEGSMDTNTANGACATTARKVKTGRVIKSGERLAACTRKTTIADAKNASEGNPSPSQSRLEAGGGAGGGGPVTGTEVKGNRREMKTTLEAKQRAIDACSSPSPRAVSKATAHEESRREGAKVPQINIEKANKINAERSIRKANSMPIGTRLHRDDLMKMTKVELVDALLERDAALRALKEKQQGNSAAPHSRGSPKKTPNFPFLRKEINEDSKKYTEFGPKIEGISQDISASKCTSVESKSREARTKSVGSARKSPRTHTQPPAHTSAKTPIMAKSTRRKAIDSRAGKALKKKTDYLNTIKIGCPVEYDGQKGTAKFVGLVHFRAGIWVGIQLSSKTGKHNGTVKGKRYFHCKPGFGLLVPAAKPFCVIAWQCKQCRRHQSALAANLHFDVAALPKCKKTFAVYETQCLEPTSVRNQGWHSGHRGAQDYCRRLRTNYGSRVLPGATRQDRGFTMVRQDKTGGLPCGNGGLGSQEAQKGIPLPRTLFLAAELKMKNNVTSAASAMTKTEQSGDQTKEPSLSGKSSRSNTPGEGHDRRHDDDAAQREGGKVEKNLRMAILKMMELKINILRGVHSCGFEKPTPIQQRAIMPIVAGRDVIARVSCGSGTTAAFVIAALEKIDTKIRETQVIFLNPTSQLARSSHAATTSLKDYTKITTHLCVGKNRFLDDKDAFRKGVQIAFGTPERVFYLMREGVLRTDNVKTIFIDNASTMQLSGGCREIYDIFELLRKDVQVALLSDCIPMPMEVVELTEKFMRDPEIISIRPRIPVCLMGQTQFYVALDQDKDKLPTLMDVLDQSNAKRIIIYANTRQTVQWLEDELRQSVCVSAIHSDLKVQERIDVVTAFRNGKSRVLISTTDDQFQGCYFQTLVTLVVNYDLPGVKEDYLHRIGRTGRHWTRCVTMNLVTNRDMSTLRELERFYKTEIKEAPCNIHEYMS